MEETETEKSGSPIDSEKNGNSALSKKPESRQMYTRTFLLTFATREECQQKPANLDQSVLKEISEAGMPIPPGTGRSHRREWDSDSAHSKSPQEVPEWRKDSWRPSSFGSGQPPLVQPPPGVRRRGQEDDSSNNAISSSYPPRPVNWDGGIQRGSHDRHGTGPQGRRDNRHNDRPIRGHNEDNTGENVGNETGPRHGAQSSNTEGGLSLRPRWGHTETTATSSDKGRDNSAILSSPSTVTDRPLGPPSRYQPPRSKQEDNPDRETFGDSDVSSTRQADLERKRREEFELMRRAQHRRNSEQKEREGEVQSRKHDIDSLWDSQSFSAESPPSVVTVSQGPRPSVPPGFGLGVRAPVPGAPPPAPPGFNKTVIANQTSEALPQKVLPPECGKVVTSPPVNVLPSHSEVGAADDTLTKIAPEKGVIVTEGDRSGEGGREEGFSSQASAVKEEIAQPKNLGASQTEPISTNVENKGPLPFLGVSENSINVAPPSGLPDQTSLTLPPFLDGNSGEEKGSGSMLDRLFKMAKDDRHSKSQSGAPLGESMGSRGGKSDPELKASKFARWFSSSNDESATELPVLSHVPQFPQGFPRSVGPGDGNASEHLDKSNSQSTDAGVSPSPPPPFLGGLGALFALAGSNGVKVPPVGILQPGAPVPGISAHGKGPVVFKSLEDIESSILAEAETASETTSVINNSQEGPVSKVSVIQNGGPFFPPSNMTEKARESASLHLLSLLHKTDADNDKDRMAGAFPGPLTKPSPNILSEGSNIFEAELLKSGKTGGESNNIKLQEITDSSTEDKRSLLQGIQDRIAKEGGHRFQNHLHDGGLGADPERSRHAEGDIEDALSFIDQFKDHNDSSDQGSVGSISKGSSLVRPSSSSGQMLRLDQNRTAEGFDGGGKQSDEFKYTTSQPPFSLNGWFPPFVSGPFDSAGPPNGGQNGGQTAEVMQFRDSASSVEPPYSSLQFATPHGTIRKPTSSSFQGPSPLDILRQTQNHGVSPDQPPSLAQQYQQLTPFHKDSSGETFIPPFNSMHQQHHYSQGNQGNFSFPPQYLPLPSASLPNVGSTNGGQFLFNQAHGRPLHDLPRTMPYPMPTPRPQLIHEIRDSSSSFNNPMQPYSQSTRHFQPSPPLSGDKGTDGGLPQWLVGDGGWGRNTSNGLSQRVAPSQMMGVEELERQLRFR